MISFTPRPLYPQGKELWYPLNRRWAGPRAGLDFSEKRKIFCLCRKRNPVSSCLESFWVQMRVTDTVTHSEGYWLLTRVINRGSLLGKWRYFPNERGHIIDFRCVLFMGCLSPVLGCSCRVRVWYRWLILVYDRSLQTANKNLPASLAYVNLITENFKSGHFNSFWTTKGRAV